MSSYVGWALPDGERTRLLHLFPPIYTDVVAHHVTLSMNPLTPLPQTDRGLLVGHVAEDGVEALIVAIDGKTVRTDGWTYHITWSLAPGRKAKDSNRIILQFGYHVAAPTIIHLRPMLFNMVPQTASR